MLAASDYMLFLKKEEKFCTIEHGMYLVEKGSKFLFNTTILLKSTQGNILELDTHPFLSPSTSKSIFSLAFLHCAYLT